jgi:hypothetical protein
MGIVILQSCLLEDHGAYYNYDSRLEYCPHCRSCLVLFAKEHRITGRGDAQNLAGVLQFDSEKLWRFTCWKLVQMKNLTTIQILASLTLM